MRFEAEYLLVGGSSTDIVSPGVVDVEDGSVTWSGSSADAPHDDAERIRLDGLLMPAFVNAHAHTPMTLFRGAGEGLPVDRWLEDVMWPREGRLTADDVAAGMRLGAAEQLTSGTGTTHEMYFFAEEMADACSEVGLRSVLCPPLIESDMLAGLGSIDEQLDALVLSAERYSDDPLIDIGLGPHSAYTLSDRILGVTGEAAERHGLHVHVHLAELPNENDLVADRGRSTTEVLDRHGLLRRGTVAAHGIHLGDEELDTIAMRGAGIVHCPVSNARHGMGLAPLGAMRARSIPLGLGTDGPASQTRIDMFEAMRQAILLQRVHHSDGDALTTTDAFLMATAGSAEVLGRPDIGHLGAGARADMVHIDLRTPSMGPILEDVDIVTSLVWAGSRECVADVWVGGRRVVEDRQLITLDFEAAQRETTERARRLATG